MAINVRYTNVGDLGNLAVDAGEGQAFNQRFAQEQQLVNSVRQYHATQEAQKLDAMRLQNAMRMTRTPTSVQSSRQGGQFAQQVQQSKATSVVPQSFAGMLNPTEQDALTMAIKTGNRDMVTQLTNKALAASNDRGGGSFSMSDGSGRIEGTGQGVQSGAKFVRDATGNMVEEAVPQNQLPQFQQAPEQAPTSNTKQQFLQARQGQISQQDMQALATAVNDPSVDLGELMIRTESALTRNKPAGGFTQGQRATLAIEQAQGEVKKVDHELKLVKDSVDGFIYQQALQLAQNGAANTPQQIQQIADTQGLEVAQAANKLHHLLRQRRSSVANRQSLASQLLQGSAPQQQQQAAPAGNDNDPLGIR